MKFAKKKEKEMEDLNFNNKETSKKKRKLKPLIRKEKINKIIEQTDNIISKARKKTEKEREKIKKLREINYKKDDDIIEAKKISKRMLAFLLSSTIIVFIICLLLFKYFIIAFSFALLFIVITLFTQVLDNNPKNSKLRRIIKKICIIGLIFAIFCIIIFIVFFIYIVIKAPKFDVSKLERGETTLVYDKDNNLIATLGTEKREKVTYDELPEVLIDAIIATEDSRFFQHNGFDAPRFLKAAFGQVLGHSSGGASTLTMQVAKNNFTSTDVSVTRKFTDIYLSIFKIEHAFTKQEIIEFYVNAPFLGSGSYGVEQASRTYFGKGVKDLTLAEASLIAGLFQAPSDYDPLVNPEEAYERRGTVLALMVRHGYITEEEAKIANSIPIESLLKNSSVSTASEYQSYVDVVIEEIINKTGLDPYVYPMLVYTNMDKTKQEAINAVFNGSSYSWPNDSVQAGAAAIESNSGKILAIGGGRNKTGERTFSYATDINRQIGSTAKPLFDYGPGIEYKNWSTGKVFDDKKIAYGGGYMTNYDSRYLGNITLRYALSDSRNVPALEAFREVENADILQFVTALGIKPEIDSDGKLHEAHAVGGFNGSNPLTMAGAYAAFSNGGSYYEPYTVNKIVLRDSEEEMEFKSAKTKVMSDSTAYMITNVLQDVANSTGIRYAAGTPVATKTGTTNYDDETRAKYGYPYSSAPDGWIVGYSPTISMAMWTGYIENLPGVYFSQSSMASHRNNLYKALASGVFDSGSDFVKPSSVVSVTIEKGTELLPSQWTPADMKITELFKRGTEPTEVSNIYVSCENVTGLTAAYKNGTTTLSWNAVNKPNTPKDSQWGDFGYFVYKDGAYINFTTGTKFTYDTSTPYGNYMVISGFTNISSNRSSGISVSIKSDISFTFNDSTDVSLNIGDTYSETDPVITVKSDGVDVTYKADIVKTIKDQNNSIVDEINTTKENTYSITYTASYLGESKTYTKTVTIS